jgi:hypothetical protein
MPLPLTGADSRFFYYVRGKVYLYDDGKHQELKNFATYVAIKNMDTVKFYSLGGDFIFASAEGNSEINYYCIDLRRDGAVTLLFTDNKVTAVIHRDIHTVYPITPNDVIIHDLDKSIYHYNAIDEKLILITKNSTYTSNIVKYKDGILFSDDGIKHYSVKTRQITSYPLGFINFPYSQIEGTEYCLVTVDPDRNRFRNIITFYS